MSENLHALCRLRLAAPAATLRVSNVSSEERLGQPARYRVVAVLEQPPEDVLSFAESAIAQEATLSWRPDAPEQRDVQLFVDEVSHEGDRVALELISRMGVLGEGRDHRTFLDQTAIAICAELLAEHDVKLDARCHRKPEKRAQCVQNFESVLAFVSRILAEDGIVWFESTKSPSTLVLVDAASAFDAFDGGSVRVRPTSGLRQETARPSVHAVAVVDEAVTNCVSLRRFDFEQPSIDTSVDAKEESGDLERYEYPGDYSGGSQGASIARMRLEGYRARQRHLLAETFTPAFAPGMIIELESNGAEDAAGRWLLVAVSTEAGESESTQYRARLEAVPAEAGYRLEPPAPASAGGVQTMTVTGASGEEIHTEAHGRVRARFRWDRRRPLDETSSAWLRVTQPANSGGFLLPRVGWEELMGYWHSADRPLALGRVYNSGAAPPHRLPEGGVVSAFGTMTSPGGGSANMVQFNDAAGNETLHFQASFDLRERTEKDKAAEIASDETLTVGKNRELIVGQVHSAEITGNQTYKVIGSESTRTS
jgi:type VI secretion system secreted protein VgrG